MLLLKMGLTQLESKIGSGLLGKEREMERKEMILGSFYLQKEDRHDEERALGQ